MIKTPIATLEHLLMDADRANHAVNFFTKAVMLEPDNPENYILRARARLKLKAIRAKPI
jgi:cytochrome c-type biogenesis protein CcmH/NrfG